MEDNKSNDGFKDGEADENKKFGNPKNRDELKKEENGQGSCEDPSRPLGTVISDKEYNSAEELPSLDLTDANNSSPNPESSPDPSSQQKLPAQTSEDQLSQNLFPNLDFSKSHLKLKDISIVDSSELEFFKTKPIIQVIK